MVSKKGYLMIITPENSIALIIDIQEKLVPHIHENKQIIKNINILLEGLKVFNMPVILNEQYPKGLGKTLKCVQEKVNSEANEKLTFSCCKSEKTQQAILKSKKNTAIVFGMETHICVLQTCLDLLTNNFAPVLVVDCCGSRKKIDHDVAISRLIQAGVVPITYEALLFELCKSSDNPLFKQVRKLVV